MSAANITLSGEDFFSDAPASALTLKQYAAHKKLPERFLQQKFGLSDMQNGLKIPYKNTNSTVFRSKVRRSMNSHDTYWLNDGSHGDEPSLPYGLWLYEGNKPIKILFLVEGESDTQTLVFHGFDAIGLSGSNGWKDKWAELPIFQRAARVIVIQEPDQGGTELVQKLAASPLQPKLYVAKLPVKDASELHLQDSKTFGNVLKTATAQASKVAAVEKTIHAPLDSGALEQTAEAIEQLMDAADIGYQPAVNWEGGLKWALDECPFCGDTTKGKAAVCLTADGVRSYCCKHASCAANDGAETPWQKFKDFCEVKPVKVEVLDAPSVDDKFVMHDMPSSVLVGRLGERCQKHLNRFPVAYAWPSILTAASVLVPLPKDANGVELAGDYQTNLYTALVGDAHSGKSQAIEAGAKLLGLYNTPAYSEVKAGSMEGLFYKINKDQTSGRLFNQVLLNLDEWSYFFNKASIDKASYATLMTTGFYKKSHSLVAAGNKDTQVNCALSWIGGIVTDQYEQCFNSTTIGGLYDRVLHGICPDDYHYDYRPFTAKEPVEQFVPVIVGNDVWDLKAEWQKQDSTLGREIELAIRAARICASADGKSVLTADYFEKFKPFMDYQHDVRKIYKPNPGDNPDAIFCNAITAWLERNAPNGKWVSLREVKRGVHANRLRLGPNVENRALNGLKATGVIEFQKVCTDKAGRPSELVRLVKY